MARRSGRTQVELVGPRPQLSAVSECRPRGTCRWFARTAGNWAALGSDGRVYTFDSSSADYEPVYGLTGVTAIGFGTETADSITGPD